MGVARLSKKMTVAEFENGYWYATEIKEFAQTIGIPHANKLRKDELQKSIKLFLETGRVALPTKRRLIKSGVKDVELGLRLDLPIVTTRATGKQKTSSRARRRKSPQG